MTIKIDDNMTTLIRDASYRKLARGAEVTEVLAILTKYVTDLDAYYTDNLSNEYAPKWPAEKHGLRVLYAELVRVGKGLPIDLHVGEGAARKAAPQVQAQAPQASLPNGTYTIAFSDGSHRTIKLLDDWREDSPAGSQVAKYLSGPDNESDYVGFAFVQGRQGRVWKKFQGESSTRAALDTLLASDLEQAMALGEAYALASGRCWRCNRLLTVPASIHRGLGPDCARKVAA